MTNYQLAFSDCNGKFHITDHFTAADDNAANRWAEQNYNDAEWYVLDEDGDNINAW